MNTMLRLTSFDLRFFRPFNRNVGDALSNDHLFHGPNRFGQAKYRAPLFDGNFHRVALLTLGTIVRRLYTSTRNFTSSFDNSVANVENRRFHEIRLYRVYRHGRILRRLGVTLRFRLAATGRYNGLLTVTGFQRRANMNSGNTIDVTYPFTRCVGLTFTRRRGR